MRSEKFKRSQADGHGSEASTHKSRSCEGQINFSIEVQVECIKANFQVISSQLVIMTIFYDFTNKKCP